jgi:hypothetical protein
MRKKFFHLSSGSVIPLTPKSGLMSTQSAIGKHINQNRGTGRMLGRNIGRWVLGHENKPALVPVRDAVERFRSAVWQVNRGDKKITTDEILDELEAGTYKNPHMMSLAEILAGCEGCESITLYNFPEQFNQMLIDGGLEPLGEARNKSTDKPELSDEQERRVRALYAEDLAIRASMP